MLSWAVLLLAPDFASMVYLDFVFRVRSRTLQGARLAAVCDKDDIHIKQKMRVILGGVVDAQISIQYAPAGCDETNCRTVEVSLINAIFTPLIPFMGVAVPLPAFTTSLPRESMKSAKNPVCS